MEKESTHICHGASCNCRTENHQFEERPITTTSQLDQYSQQMKELRLVDTSSTITMMNRRQFVRKGMMVLGGLGLMALVPGCIPGTGTSSREQETSVTPVNSDLELTDISIGYLPIACASPVIVAETLGLFRKHGLNVTLKKFGGWSEIRDSLITKEIQAAHVLSPMALAMSLGVGSTQIPTRLATMKNINGSAITLSMDLKDKVKEIHDLKGMRLGIPYEQSPHTLLLRHFLTEGGLDPDVDVELRLTRPPDMIANLASKNLDGYIVAEPFNQRVIQEGFGYIYKLTGDIWENHPCCGFSVTQDFIDAYPKTYQALLTAIIEATNYCRELENRNEIARLIAPSEYLNQSEELLAQVMTGQYKDGLGNAVNNPNRINFDPFPWKSSAAFLLTQMIRWGQISPEQAANLDILKVADEVFLTEDVRKVQQQLGYSVPAEDYRIEKIMGRSFDVNNMSEWMNM